MSNDHSSGWLLELVIRRNVTLFLYLCFRAVVVSSFEPFSSALYWFYCIESVLINIVMMMVMVMSVDTMSLM